MPWRSMMALLWRWLPLAGTRHSAAHLGAATVAVALILKLLQCALDVPSGWGVEDFLGWVDMGPEGPVGALAGIWENSGRTPVVWAYLVIDSVVFMPLYGAYALSLSLLLSNALADDRRDQVSGSERLVLTLLSMPLAALLLTDLVENAVGLARTGALGTGLAIGVSIGAAVMLWRLPPLRIARDRLAAWVLPVAFAIGLALCLAAAFGGTTCAGTSSAWPWRLGCGGHQAKGWLIGIVVGLLLLATASWLFGVRLEPQAGRNDDRSHLRSAIWDIVVRSRYVLLALVLVAALTVTLDQGRDVLYAVAGSAFRDGEFNTLQRIRLAVGSLVAFVVAAVAVWLFVFACWFWTRSVCIVRSARSGSALVGIRQPGHEDLIANYWARMLGLMPAVLLALLCAGVVSDAVRSQGTNSKAWEGPVWVVSVFGGVTIALGILFLRQRLRNEEACYYDCLTWRQWSRLTGLKNVEDDAAVPGKYIFGGFFSAYRLPLVLAAAMLLCRAVDVYQPAAHGGELIVDYLPTLSFAILLFEVALWLCFFGWLSILEVHRSTPWVGIVLAVSGLFGALGWTTNHVVWPAISGPASDPWGAMKMLLFTALLVGWLMLVYQGAIAIARRYAVEPLPGGDHPGLHRVDGCVALLLLTLLAGVLWAADYWASPRRVLPAELAANERPTLSRALAAWLGEVCGERVGDDCAQALAPEPGGGVRVHFVSTEGGGIRAAAWTAFLLDRLTAADPTFPVRTFSMSGVSGGAVGLAAYRACTDSDPARRANCIRRLAGSNLLSPLLSAWMFEDVLGRVLPSRWCDTPACGILSRGAWFEQALENGTVMDGKGGPTSGMRGGLIRNKYEKPHVPYLLLNATWVETGERAIASDLLVRWEQFRGAKDQIDITGVSMPLGAAAHNAARFPFVNAIGALQAPPRRCLDRLAAPLSKEAERQRAEKFQDRSTCGHIADGGYFDNSGAQTTIDILHALGRCLNVVPGDSDAVLYPECLQLDGNEPQRQRERKHRAWFSRNLVPQVLMIRNSVNPASAREEACPPFNGRAAPTARDVATAELASCTALADKGYAPERPVCRRQSSLFIDLTGPALTVLNVSGIGANGQLAEARQSQAVHALRLVLGGAGAKTPLASTQVLDLMPDGVRYPLGWHLSALAVDRMSEQAERCAAVHRPAARASAASRAAVVR